MTKIEWTNVTWNPVTGCNKVSQGCKNCYAEIMHRRLRGMFPKKYTGAFLSGANTHYGELMKPHDWKKPVMVFVNSMSDLFHKDVPFEFIDLVFVTMSDTERHTYQVLTKRAERMYEFYEWKKAGNGFKFDRWPLQNVWVGVSCEDQENADERIPFLIKVPAAIRFLSCEPLIDKIDFRLVPGFNLAGAAGQDLLRNFWVIAGGESGHNARPMHPDWLRKIRDQCKVASVPFFFKQWGEFMPYEPHWQAPFYYSSGGSALFDGHQMNFLDPETGEAGRWNGRRWYDPMDSVTLCVETKSRNCAFLHFGKKHSGNFLDGIQHLEFPKTPATFLNS